MVLVDTSVWIDHLRRGDGRLVEMLESADVVCHPMVIGELACGSLRRRREILDLLTALPRAAQASHDQILAFIDARHLHGRGIGLTDAHLLWTASQHCHRLWTRDQRLHGVAGRLGVAAE